MPEPTLHPTHNELSAFTLGQLPPEAAQQIEEHINKCDPCCETMLGLSSNDTFVDLLQKVGATRQPPSDTSSGESDAAVPAPLSNHSRYEIEKIVGRGGMGRVYQARHRMMDRTVALKVIHQEWVRNREAIDRFRREVKTAASLTHPNIVTAHDAEQADDLHFLVMEYVDGVDLAQTVKQRGPLPVAEACDFIRQAADGLQYAHERGMVHRDIKPHNLIVTPENVVKILDFGLASLAPQTSPEAPISEVTDGNLTVAGAIMGTPDFISPEQAVDARNVDGRSDIYSLGMTLYYLLAGRVPFGEGSAPEKLKQHAEAEPVSLATLRGDVPEHLQDIVSRMTAKDPDERIQSPKQVAEALSAFASEPSVSGAAASTEPRRRGLLLKWLGGATLAIAVAAAGLLFFGGSDPEADYEKMTVFLQTGGSDEPVGDIAARLLRSDAGRKYLRKLDAENPELAYTEGKFARGYTSVTAFAFEDRAMGVPQPKLLLNGWSLTTSGMATRNMIEAFTLESIRFDNAPDHECLAILQYRTPAETELALGLRPNSIYEADVPLDDLIEGPVSMSNLFKNGTLVRDLSQPAMVSALKAKPEVKIFGKMSKPGASGLPSVHDWEFSGHEVGDLKVRLLLAQNGKTEVMQEFDFEELPADFANKVRLEVKDAGTGADRKRRVNAILFVGRPVPSSSTTLNEDKGLSIDVEAPFSNKMELGDLEPIEPGQTELLLALSYWKGDMTHDLSMESMTAATKDGNATFLFVTLDWSPANPDVTQLQGDWETVSVTESGKQLAIENGFGGLLLQIKGNRFVIKERKPNGDISDVDTGRIEIGSTATPKTIDFIDRDQPNRRFLGIYELKGGVLRMCLVEQGGTDAPEGERISDTKPLKRPTTFDSPAGSNFMLMEFRRTSENTRKVPPVP